MNKAELIERLASSTGTSKKAAGDAVEALAIIIKTGLQAGDSMPLPGVGIIEAVKRQPRKSRNPRTGEAIELPARVAVKLKASKPLKDALNS